MGTTAAELSIRGFRVKVVAQDLGYRPPLTIVGTQSRRWPGSAISNQTFDNDDLLDKELQTISRFLALSSRGEETGVAIIPALKVSKTPNNTWNRRPLDEKRYKAASAVQRSMRMVSNPANVDQEDINAFLEAGYKSVDETQVVRIETNKYFTFLMNLITAAGGSIDLGTYLTKEDLNKLRASGHVVNCLANNAGTVGGSTGTYYYNPGEVLIWGRCPRDFDYYIMDDDKDAGVMMTTDGRLYLSTAAKAGPNQTATTVSDCYESWKTDRPMRKEGFNIGARETGSGWVSADNSGHGGAGVAASWACAALVTDCLVETINRNISGVGNTDKD